MKLTVLGSGGIRPDLRRAGPAHLLSEDGAHLLLDAGPGMLRALLREGISAADLRGLVVTHRHPDHVAELVLLLENECVRRRSAPLALAAPAILDAYLAFHAAWGRAAPKALPYRIERHVLPGPARIGPFEIESRSVPHVEHSVGVAVRARGRCLVYPGDCGPGAEVIELARGADLLLIECSLPAGERSAAHLAPADAAEIALRAGVRRLVLTHFPPEADAETAVAICRQRGLDVLAAEDGMQLEV
ncbi:MAG: MBL fold metallo-hydrolase [Deltaproteobacteria bacterium]|nr:MBL fold metallo-hydrolase [Deltaproteobacteria bacterium]